MTMLASSAAGAAFDAFLRETAPASRQRPAWTPADGPMPTLYLSHGAPPLFDDAGWIQELFAWAQALPRPRAILIVSAHWESAPLSLSASAPGTPLVYDFAGFDRRYFEMRYATPDAGALARGDVDTLASYRSKAPAVQFAHPTVEHYTPLFVTLGAATDAEQPVQTTIEGYFIGLSKRSFQAA
jgi:aromatic ring-opening dioxygenase catalytic subunit (LigB family)